MRALQMFTFEWDDAKAASNQRKHGVAFDEAVTVFADALALTFTDSDHYRLRPFRQRGPKSNHRSVDQGALLVVVHTERRNNLRIISARKATRHEEGIYRGG